MSVSNRAQILENHFLSFLCMWYSPIIYQGILVLLDHGTKSFLLGISMFLVNKDGKCLQFILLRNLWGTAGAPRP